MTQFLLDLRTTALLSGPVQRMHPRPDSQDNLALPGSASRGTYSTRCYIVLSEQGEEVEQNWTQQEKTTMNSNFLLWVLWSEITMLYN